MRLRLEDAGRSARNALAAPPNAAQLLYGNPARAARYRCLRCGRFVPAGTVTVVPHWEYGYGPEQDTYGDCAGCGTGVDVTWGVE